MKRAAELPPIATAQVESSAGTYIGHLAETGAAVARELVAIALSRRLLDAPLSNGQFHALFPQDEQTSALAVTC